MKTSRSTTLMPMRVPVATGILLALYLGWWLCTLPFQLAVGGGKLHYLLLPASLLAVVFVANQRWTLDAVWQVMAQRRLPPAFCRRTARDGVVQMAAAHAFLVISCTVQVATPKAGLQLPTAAAVLSVLAAATWLVLALFRRMPRTGFAAGLALGLLAISGLGHLPEVLRRIDALPFAMLVLLGLLWPALLWRLAARPGDVLAKRPAVSVRPADALFEPIRQLLRRITFLTLEGHAGSTQATFGGQRSWFGVLLNLWVFWLPRNDAFARVVFPPLCVVMLATTLAAFDLHWRHVLSPGGWRRANIGLRLWTSTFAVYAFLLGAMTVGRDLVRILDGNAWAWPGAFAVVVDCAEVGFMVALGVLLRGLMRGSWIIFVLSIGALVLEYYWAHDQAWLMALRQHAGYPLVLAGATAIAIAASNRAWTVQQLVEAARR